jgi:hypothetical protein
MAMSDDQIRKDILSILEPSSKDYYGLSQHKIMKTLDLLSEETEKAIDSLIEDGSIVQRRCAGSITYALPPIPEDGPDPRFKSLNLPEKTEEGKFPPIPDPNASLAVTRCGKKMRSPGTARTHEGRCRKCINLKNSYKEPSEEEAAPENKAKEDNKFCDPENCNHRDLVNTEDGGTICPDCGTYTEPLKDKEAEFPSPKQESKPKAPFEIVSDIVKAMHKAAQDNGALGIVGAAADLRLGECGILVVRVKLRPIITMAEIADP